MLYLIGLGLDDGEITQKGLDALKEVDQAFAEFYTNTQTIDIEKIEERTGTEIEVLDRDSVEREDKILKAAEEKDTAFLVSGDSLTATTHYDIKFRAERKGIDTKVIHAPSIFLSIAETGLSIYKFGRVATLPKKGKPQSVLDYIPKNDSIGLHTLILLDINYRAEKAAQKIIEMNENLAEREVVVLERANQDSQSITVAKLEDISDADLGETPHSIIFTGETSHKEDEFLGNYRE